MLEPKLKELANPAVEIVTALVLVEIQFKLLKAATVLSVIRPVAENCFFPPTILLLVAAGVIDKLANSARPTVR